METTLDLTTVWHMIRKHLRLLIALTLCVTAIAAGVTMFLITPKYTSSALLYVENKQTQTESLNINDLNVAQKLVNTCVIIFENDVVLQKVQDALGLQYGKEEFRKMVSLTSVNNTEVLKVEATSANAGEAAGIVNTLIAIAPQEFTRIVKSGSIELVSPGAVSSSPSSPKVAVNIAVGFAVGMVLSLLVVFLIEILDITVKGEDDLYKLYAIPVFAEIMDFDSKVKGE